MDYNVDDHDETALIREANSMTDYIATCKLQKSICVESVSFNVINLTSHSLSPPQKAAVFELLRTNMREYYDAEPTWVCRTQNTSYYRLLGLLSLIYACYQEME